MSRRPEPDELLAIVRKEELRAAQGKLTIFFGAAPGVGKTYTMLEAARVELDQKHDVVIGVVETHARYDTEALVLGFEMLARRRVTHEGVAIGELDLDAVLARRPELVLVDELAHTNAPGSRHRKRWQDVRELLEAGIDVFTTLNVQHLESLNDVVAQITGVTVRETVPDSVFDDANDVRLVDLPVDELLARLREGKVYLADQAERAMQSFFREGNLIALRELALRRTAERVDAQMRGYKVAHGIEETWHAGERVLVCVSASPYAKQLVRAARRMATSLHAELIGAYVETPAALRMSGADRDRLAQNLRLVEQLGGDAVTLRAADSARAIVEHARKRNVTKIVVGKPMHPRWRDLVRQPFLDEVVRLSREIDVYVISGLEPSQRKGPEELERASKPRARLVEYAASAAVLSAATIVAWLAFGPQQLADVAMTLLFGVVLVAMRFGPGPSLFAAVLGVLSLDFFFVPPFFTLDVTDLRHTVTFAVLFVVAVVISQLTRRVREQADAARARERHTASLFAVSRELAAAPTRARVLAAASHHVREVFASEAIVLLPDAGGAITIEHEGEGVGEKDLAVARWVWTHQRPAGLGTDTLPGARALYVPLRGARGPVGVLGLVPPDPAQFQSPDERLLLDTLAGLVASAIERAELAEEARRAQLHAETERLRNALLSSVSHDRRTPLGVVTGATSALLEPGAPADEATRRELLRTAHEEAMRLSRLVRNLLDMTRLDAGALGLKKELQPLEEIVGSALGRMEDRLAERAVTTDVPKDLPLVPIDSALMEQVLINLLENATKYTPPKTPIDVRARAADAEVIVEVADRGPGVPPEEADRIFEKFYRVRQGEGGGVGLGLTICRGIVEAHGGSIAVHPRDGGGAVFRFTIPLGAVTTEQPKGARAA